MKNIFPALLSASLMLFTQSQLLGQLQISGDIRWNSPQKYSESITAPYFDGADFDLQLPHLPKYCQSLDINGALAGSYDVSFTQLSFTDAAPEEIAAINKLGPGAEPELKYYTGQSVNNNKLSVCFYPYVKRQGVVRKVSSFEISITPRYGRASESQSLERGAFRKSSAQAASVLDADGWYKLSVGNTGLFKITPTFLASNNIATGNVSISDIRIVGNGTGMLPERNAEPRPQGLQEVPVEVFDNNNDGVFNGNDYAVFYARGPHQWVYDTSNNRFEHRLNVYRTQNYYFLSVTNGPAAQVPMANPIPESPTVQVNSFDDYDFEEVEENNLVGTGREWFGNLFDFDLQYNSKTFSFPNKNSNAPVEIRLRALARASSGNTFMTASANGQQIARLDFGAYGTGDYSPYARSEDTVEDFNLNNDNFVVQLEYNNSANPAGVAWLDFIQVQTRRNLIYNGKPIFFRDQQSVGAGQVAEYIISGVPTDLKVWDITGHNQVKEMPVTLNNGTATFVDTADQLKEYAAFSGSNLPEPGFVGSVARQNLRGLPAAEMLIVTHPNFMSAANRLADFHRNNDNISTHVVTVGEVYNEFSSGGQDIAAIRDFARLNYEKSLTDSVNFNYILLFGDASYDYKDRLSNNTNFVPVYEGGSSLNLQLSFITDDFFAYLDPNEGNVDNDFTGELMDVGVGRIPAVTLSEAQSYVDKVIHYTNSERRFGDWRNKILLMADDVDDQSGWETIFVQDSESLENIVNNRSKAFNVDKIYTDSYDQENTTGSESYPEASNDMFRKVQQGNLVTNYIGHGGEIGLSSEKLLKLTDVNGWTNLDAMPLFTTITCEFTRLDDPKRTSAGEQLALNPQGGAIGLISTTRTVLAGPAIVLNKAIFREAFERPGNIPKTLGEIIRDSKNDLAGNSTKLKFSLIGDPAVRLAIPFYRIQTNSINGKNLTAGNIDTLKGLSKVTISAQVNDFADQKLTDFSGISNVSVYDKPSNKETQVNDGVGPALPFTLRNNLIYKGKVEVREGDFEFSFIVPKDISLKFGNGKISLYAEKSGLTDAAGYMDTVTVGGLNNNVAPDNEGPVVELYMNDESFVRGGITDEDPDLYAVISDSSGINTVGTGVGHDLIAVLDNETEQTYVLNEYYEADLNSYQSGTVRYPFFELAEGSHTLKMRVFDVHNNFSEAQTEFIVADSEELALEKVLNYPNPFTTYTEFQFEHNRSSQPLEVQVQVFTVSGKLVKTINELVVSEGNRVSGIAWRGLDDYGDKIGKGVYVYRVKVRSRLDNSSAEEYEKLVILR